MKREYWIGVGLIIAYLITIVYATLVPLVLIILSLVSVYGYYIMKYSLSVIKSWIDENNSNLVAHLKYLLNQVQKQLPTLLFVVYCCIMFVAMESFWTGLINERCPRLISTIYNSLDNFYINFINTIFLIGFGIYCFRVFRKKHINLVLYPIILATAWLLVWGNTWQAKETVFPYIKYNYICFLWIALFVGVKFYDSSKRFVNKINDIKAKEIFGFSIDRDNGNNVNVGWNSVCDTLCKELSNTSLKSESFAVGITGEWGSGKTTFLGLLRNKLKEEFLVVDYNPWNCQGTGQIVEDFFLRLNESIYGEEELTKSIKKYSDALSNIDEMNLITSVIRSFRPKKDKSIQSLKKEINDISKMLMKPIAIIIDDIDRLDKDETLEVLKLIRITANFANMVFVVAYDTTHVVNMLSENGIENGNEYLKKMFQLEYSLPAYENYKIQELLFKEIKKVIKNDDDLKQLKHNILTKDKETDQYLILKYIHHFRDVKRFVNIFMLNQIELSKYKGDFDVIDLFWLELLHYSDIETYNDLYKNSNRYLSLCNDGKGLFYYMVKDEKVLREDESMISFVESDSLYLLKQLFNSRSRNNSQLRYSINFLNYFCFRLPEYGISSHMIVKLLNENTQEKVLIEKLESIVNGNLNKHNSFIAQLSKVDVKTLLPESQKRFIYILVWAGNKLKEEIFSPVFVAQLSKSLYCDGYISDFQTYTSKIIKDYLLKSECHEKWARLLCALYPVSYLYLDNEYEFIEPDTLLDKNDIIDLLKYDFELLIEKNGYPNIEDIMSCKFLSAFTTKISVEDYGGDENYEKKKNLVFEIILDWYSKNRSKNFEDFHKQFDYDFEMYDEDIIIESYQDDVKRIFGNSIDYKIFLSLCFDVDDDVIKKHLTKIGII